MSGTPSLLRFGFLASHNGSNLQALLDACADGRIPGIPAVVISNNLESGALRRARNAGVDAVHLSGNTHLAPADLDAAILAALRGHAVDWVLLCGYMKKLGPQVLEAYSGRILNIHPSLLPAFGGPGMFGIHVHQAALAAGVAESGATVHLVDGDYDRGPIVEQTRVPVLAGDTPESLQARVLPAEHALYTRVVARIADGKSLFPESA